MVDSMKTVYKGGVGEIIEKKSRFLATVRIVHSEEEALAFIEQMKKKYWDATHNCSAYVIGEKNERMRCSDDGEPQGTAGKPMLDVLLGQGIHNVAVVVTRYFGGTLLGTGGLVRAYSGAVQAGLKASIIIERKYGALFRITTDYNGVGKLQYLFGQEKTPVLDAQYTDVVTMKVLVPIHQADALCRAVTEATSGKAGIQKEEELYYAVLDKRVLIKEELEC